MDVSKSLIEPNYRLFTALLIYALCILSFVFAASMASAAERKFSIGSYENVQIEGDLIVNIETDKGTSAKAVGSTRQLSLISFTRNGRTLKIQLKNNLARRKASDFNAEPLEIFISTTVLKNVTLRGNGAVTINKMRSRKSELSILGSGEITLGSGEFDCFNIIINGGGSVQVEGGNSARSSFSILGTGAIDARDMQVKQLNIKHSGPANSAISVTGDANIDNNGTGSIEILGTGSCLVKSIGSGRIICQNIVTPDN